MNPKSLHPNTNTLLEAWQRITTPTKHVATSIKTSDHPDLLDCLFVIERTEEGPWVFKNAGSRLSDLLGRELGDHDYLDFWTGHDRSMVTAFLNSVIEGRKPGLLRASGETLTGMRIDIELTLAPLSGLQNAPDKPRLLGLYQPLGGEGLLMGRPVWRHRLTAIHPPHVKPETSHLKLVANND